MLTTDYLLDISDTMSEFKDSLPTVSFTVGNITVTDKLNSFSSFLITDILSIKKSDNLEHLPNESGNFKSTEIPEQQQNYRKKEDENSSRSQYDKEKLADSSISDNNNNNAHFWDYLFQFLAANSSLYTKQILSDHLQSSLSTYPAQSPFSQMLKEKTEEDKRVFPDELNRNSTQNHHNHEQHNENKFKSSINLDNTQSFKQLCSEFWRYILEDSSGNYNNTNNQLKNYDAVQLNNSNLSKLCWTKLNDQCLHYTFDQLKQIQDSMFNSDNTTNNNIYTQSMDVTRGEKEVDREIDKTRKVVTGKEKVLNFSNVENTIKTCQVNEMKAYKVWFNSMNCLNAQQKISDLYKSHHLIKNYFKETNGLTNDSNHYTQSSKRIPVNIGIDNNHNNDNNNDNNDSIRDDNNATNNGNSSSGSYSNISLTPSSFGPNSALDALIHMTTSTMQQLKHEGDISDEFHEQSSIQFYNKVSQTRKRRKTRTTFSNSQLNELENNFNRQKYLTPSDRDRIAKHLGLTNTQVITWFQNRRAKLKREAEELERDVMALRKQKQQKFDGFSSCDHEHQENDDEEEEKKKKRK
ncbi:unnamed protein product [Heterobilharzia americana]|nr:unnamed protein product [Heterobilharzia americana]